MVENWEEYDEQLDRAIQAWQESKEFKGGGRRELVRFFSQRTVDDYFESVKAELEGRKVAGRTVPETQASIQEWITKGSRSDEGYKKKSEFGRAMLYRLKQREAEAESWKTVREYIKPEEKKEEDPWKTIRDYLKEGK